MIANCTEIINESSKCWLAYSINNIDTINDSLQAFIYKLDGQIFVICAHLAHIQSSGMFKHMPSNPFKLDIDNRTIHDSRCLSSSQLSIHLISYELHESSSVDGRRYQIQHEVYIQHGRDCSFGRDGAYDRDGRYGRNGVYERDGRYGRDGVYHTDDVNDVLAECVADAQSIDRDDRVKKMADLCMRDGYDASYQSDYRYNAGYESDYEYDDDWHYDNDADME